VRGSLEHELLYQLPLAIAMGLAAHTAFRLSRQRGLSLAMPVGAVFTVIALHFPIKAFVAAGLGTGASPRDYAGSNYALISQATMAVLLVNAGLMVLLLVAQDAMATSLYDAETDPLTQLHNRRGFFRRATALVEQARTERAALSAIMFDLDHFKRVNDTYGHATGDAVLRAFADCLRAVMPEEAIIGRLGGEEFAVLLPQRTMEGARLPALGIAAAMRDFPAQALPAITVSGGLAEYRTGDDIDDLIGRADAEAYAAKAAGRDRLRPAPPSEAPDE
jgi:diguanylate cyclase (GGDEF)-like protein